MIDTRMKFFLQVTRPKVVALSTFGSTESESSLFTGCLVGVNAVQWVGQCRFNVVLFEVYTTRQQQRSPWAMLIGD
jgi:Zn-dependent membrane protease YugP